MLNACARAPALLEGKQVHAQVVQLGFLRNKFVITALLDLYAKCGDVPESRSLFDTMDDNDKDVVACTAVICGYTKIGLMDDAQRLFDSMTERNVISWSAMVAGYANCGNMEAAKEFYDTMTEKNSVTWVAMIAGYGKRGDVREAKKVFDEIVEPDASCWAAMTVCYVQNGYAKAAIEMYKVMRGENVRISEVAMVGAISACAQLGDVEMAATLAKHVDEGYCGKFFWQSLRYSFAKLLQLVSHQCRFGPKILKPLFCILSDRTNYISNALIHMHSKCGCLDLAWREFSRTKNKDVISYSSMITAFADHGKSQEALDMFLKMRNEGIKPNQVTFIGILSACSHGGLVEDGCNQFELMTRVFGIKPLTEHLTCMVDLLGRSGQLEKAYSLLMDYKDFCDAGTWGALLGACKLHVNAELGEIAARHLLELEPENTGNYALLANIYASIGEWKDSERVKMMISETGKKKSPACSWISS